MSASAGGRVIFASILALASAAPGVPRRTMVVCAPGYPGTTATAQSAMDAFALAVAAAASRPPGSLRAVYFETAEGGLRALRQDDAALALVTLPFYLQHESDLKLAARLQVVPAAAPGAAPATGALGTWSLVARRGRIASAAALDGWEVTGTVGYAPEFVRGPVLGRWGVLPPSARITVASGILSALRRAAAGESVAVILDGTEAAALPTLPFGADLEIVTRSPPYPGTLLCSAGGRMPPKELEGMAEGLRKLGTVPGGAEVLTTMRTERFEPVDAGALQAARAAFAAARSGRGGA